jgi:ketosteroid isomerase-like protein
VSRLTDHDDFLALRPFFRIVEEALTGIVDGADLFDRYVSVLTLEGRKVIRWRDYLDPLAVFDALGWPHPPR